MFRSRTEFRLHSVLHRFTSFGDGQKYIFPSSRLESWAPELSKHPKAISVYLLNNRTTLPCGRYFSKYQIV